MPLPAEPVISWNYTGCPPEDECANGHHTCHPLSETCVDRTDGFSCVCSTGYVLSGYVALCRDAVLHLRPALSQWSS